jgi:Holliday junction resolvase RusA-like endonuclease
MRLVEFFVNGHPVPKQSFRVLRSGGGYIEKDVRAWQEKVRRRAENEMQGRSPSRSWVEVELDFVLQDNRRVDLDNLSKGVLDALKKVVYIDDSQIIHLLLHKHLGSARGVYILVSEVEEEVSSNEEE